MENKFLTYKQFSSLVLIILVTTNFLVIPYISSSLISIICGLILGCIYLLFYRDVNLNNKFIKYIYSLKLILTSGILVGFFTKIAKDIFLDNSNIYVILTVIFMVVLYCGFNNQSIGTVGRILFIFILLPIIFVSVFSLNDVKLINIYNSVNNTGLVDIFTISIISLIFEIVFLLGNSVKRKLTKGDIFKPVIIAIIILIITNICLLGRFGDSVYNYKYPSFELMYSSDLPGYIIQRQEGILISVFLFGVLVTASTFILLSLELKPVFNKKYVSYIIIYILALISVCYKNVIDLYIWVNLFGGIIIILLSFFWRGEKNNV